VKTRERLAIPPTRTRPASSRRYKSDALGEVAIARKGEACVFDIGEWASPVASRKNDDGTISFITIGPTLQGFEFVVGEKDGKRTLIVRDAQHEYVFDGPSKHVLDGSAAPPIGRARVTGGARAEPSRHAYV
jgi:hypothetical protein